MKRFFFITTLLSLTLFLNAQNHKEITQKFYNENNKLIAIQEGKIYTDGSAFNIIKMQGDEPPAMFFDVTITGGCIITIIPNKGAVNLYDLISNKYDRILTYEFENGLKRTYTTKNMSRNTTEYVTHIKGETPKFWNDAVKAGKIELFETATFNMFNSKDGKGVTYSGTAKYDVNGKIHNVKITSEYIFEGKRLEEDQKFKIISGSTSINKNLMEKKAKFQITK
jgi:hypothetical protein